MSQDINSVIVVGRITRDAELKYTGSGVAISNFSVASNRRVKKGEQWVDEASFFDFALFNKTAENLNKYLTKGQQVIVKGELRQDRWEKDGQKFSKVTVSVETVQLIGGKREGVVQSQERPALAPAEGGHGSEDFDPSAYEDDIPF